MGEVAKGSEPTLSEFVSSAILDISDGLHDAQSKGRDRGVKIYPQSYGNSSTPMNIEFDLSVRSIAQGGKGGGVKLEVTSLFGVNYANGTTSGIDSSNRIHFTVPVHFVIFNAPDSTRPQINVIHERPERDY